MSDHVPFNLISRINTYFTFSRLEIRNLIISILVVGFIVGFDDKKPSGSLGFWVFNLINSILIVSLAFIVHEAGHRLSGLVAGYRAEYKVWWYGLLIGLILTIISRGQLWVILPGGYMCDMMQRARLGRFRYGINYFTLGLIGYMGGLFNIILAMIFKFMLYIPFFADNALIEKAILVNVAYAIYSLLPLPGLDGINVLFASRIAYVSLYSALIVASVLLVFYSIFLAVVGSVIALIASWIIWYFVYEEKSW